MKAKAYMKKYKAYELWVLKAESDLYTAQKMAENGEKALDAAIGHTQQCAEKSLKAYLVYHNIPIQKTHDLVKLLFLCSSIDPMFSILSNEIACLNPLSTEFRYPEEELYLPTKELMQASIYRAETVLCFVKSKLDKKE